MKNWKKQLLIEQVEESIKNVILKPCKYYALEKVNLQSITALFSQFSILAKDVKNIIVVFISGEKICIDR